MNNYFGAAVCDQILLKMTQISQKFADDNGMTVYRVGADQFALVEDAELFIDRYEDLATELLDKTLSSDRLNDFAERLPKGNASLVTVYMRRLLALKDSPAHVQRLLADFEIAADKDLSVSKILAKLGPMLGLMDTLIPTQIGRASCRERV